MSLQRIPGGIWVPTFPFSNSSTGFLPFNESETLLDADEEEIQILGRVCLAAGSGSKTFGTSGSKIGWLGGSSITFGSGSTLRVGVKKSSSWDDASGPPGRATIGAAAFDVYKNLVGGTDTITSAAWRDDAMASGSGFTVSHGDRLAVCFHLDTTSGSPSVKVRSATTGTAFSPLTTLVTSGPTYTAQAVGANIILTFDDGTIGWLDPATVFLGSPTQTAVGNGVILGNVFTLPFSCKVDAVMAAHMIGTSGAANFDIGFWSTPAGTPAPITNGTVSIDPNNLASGVGSRPVAVPLPAEITLAAGTAYAVGIKQNSATDISLSTWTVNNVAHWQPNGLDSNCYAASSSGGGAFSSINSGKTRAVMYFRISQLDDGAGGAGGLLTHPGMAGGMRG